MQMFEYILILLVAILISNIINRFLPVLSVPIIQVVLGVLIALLPIEYTLNLNTELFFIIFIAPLLFHDGAMMDKRLFWKLKKPILLLSFGLVLLTVFLIGHLVHFLIPSIPLAAAFALAAALAPTDAVAISALGKRIKMPHTIIGMLEGEALINDASGLVSFQFAIAAMVTGTFSLMHAGGRLVIIAVGGVAVGLLVTFLIMKFVRWLRSFGMENVTLHILVNILMPFLVYIVAEQFEVSGILAVVSSGVMHSFTRKKINPEMAGLNNAAANVWETLVFVLNGLVFLILGTQLPAIVTTVWADSSINKMVEIVYILIITAALMLLRFIWSFITFEKDIYKAEDNLSKAKASLIISMTGVRGAVTLATIMSVPFLLNDGSAFPHRDLILFIVSGVILSSLIVANFILPLFFKKEAKTNEEEETIACIEIVKNVIIELNNEITEKNSNAVLRVLWDYRQREEDLKRKLNGNSFGTEEEISLKKKIYEWQRENTRQMLAAHEVDEATAEQYLKVLCRMENIVNRNKKKFLKIDLRGINVVRRAIKKFDRSEQNAAEVRKRIYKLYKSNDMYVLEKLKALDEGNSLVKKYIADYELSLSIWSGHEEMDDLKREEGLVNEENVTLNVEDIVTLGFQIERNNIQTMYENGRISWETAQRMRENISLMEIQLARNN